MKNKSKKLVNCQRDQNSIKKSTTYCIICSNSKFKNDTKLYRISEQHSAKNLISEASFFYDDVQTWCIISKTPSDVMTERTTKTVKVAMFWNSNEKLSLLSEIAMTLKTNVPKLLSEMSLWAWIWQQVLTIYLISVKKSPSNYFYEKSVRA